MGMWSLTMNEMWGILRKHLHLQKNQSSQLPKTPTKPDVKWLNLRLKALRFRSQKAPQSKLIKGENMGFISGILISMLEKELAAQTPEVEQFVLQLLDKLGKDLIGYVERKVNVDLNGDGVIGDSNHE